MYDKFHAYLSELEANFNKLAELLHQKLSAVETFDIDRLDSIMKEEQAFVLLSKSFDSHIANYREKFALKGEKLGDLVEELPEAEQPRFRDIAARLKAALDEVKALNEKCQGLIEERLYSLDKAINELDHSRNVTYGDNAKSGQQPAKPSDSPTLINKKI